MEITTFELWPMGENCYIVSDEKEAVIIDPGYPQKELVEFINKNNLTLKYILLTHGHFDHIEGVNMIREAFPKAKLAAGKEEEGLLKEPFLNASSQIGRPLSIDKIDVLLEDNEEITFGNTKINVIATPGHTKGGVSFLMDKALFCGDTLFYNSIGRTDLPTGNYSTLEKSVKEKIYALDEDIILLCGHGEKSTIKEEKQNNPFFRG